MFIANRCNDTWNIFLSFLCLNKYILHLESRISAAFHLSVIVRVGDGGSKAVVQTIKRHFVRKSALGSSEFSMYSKYFEIQRTTQLLSS